MTDIYQTFGIDTDHPKVERVEAETSDYAKYGVDEGDLFFTRSSLVLSGIAQCNVVRHVKEPTLFECHVMRLRPNRDEVNSDFLAMYAQSHTARLFLMRQAKHVTMTTISQPDLIILPVPVPSLGEQQQIANRVLAVEAQWRREAGLLEKFRQQKSGLMQDLLTGKVRVKVDEAEVACAHA